MMHRYEIIIYWSKEDAAYVAEVPELPGCMAHGSSDAEAFNNIHQAMELWLSTAREDGAIIPTPRERRLMYA